jgi:hypothetical protein
VAFEDEAVADFFDRMVDAGRKPEEFGRIWVHTHPGNSAEPSGTDELTFARVFGRADWAVMLIVARGGQIYARLRYNVGPGADILLPFEIDYGRPFPGCDLKSWLVEYEQSVRTPPADSQQKLELNKSPELESDWWQDAWDEYVENENYPVEEAYGYIRDF